MTLAERAHAHALEARASAMTSTKALEYWHVATPDRAFYLFLCPPQPQSWVLAQYPGAGATASTFAEMMANA